VAVESLNTNYSLKYLGTEAGVTTYTSIDEHYFLWDDDVISAAEREVTYVIDGLMHNGESLPNLGILRLWANTKNDREATAYLVSKTFLCASGWWYILGRNREFDAVRRSGLYGMV
jgi:TnpA family transposase